MSYTKLDGSGNVLPDSATSWVMVKDNVTGLVWEIKTNKDGVQDYNNPHDADNTYQGNSYKQWYYGGFLNALNGANYGGYSDWRMPTIKELANIVKYSSSSPKIDTGYFTDAVSSGRYWSSTTYAGSSSSAWFVDFRSNSSNFYDKGTAGYVRAVRGGQSVSFDPLVIGSFDAVDNGSIDDATASAGSYTDNGDDTVTDTSTGLTWQKASSFDRFSGWGSVWERALAHCEGLNLGGHTDWRLPTIKEFQSLVDYNRHSPAISTTYFPDVTPHFYWASTNNRDGASAVNLWYGSCDDSPKTAIYHDVIAVRGGQTELLGNLVISPASSNVPKNAGTTTFSVSNTGTGTMQWTAAVTSGGSWLSITSGVSGTDTGTITCSFTSNTSTSARTATIRVTATGATGSPVDVTVTQAGNTQPVLSVSPATQNVAKDIGTTSFSVFNTGTGTMPWTAVVTSGGSWLSITSGGSGTDTGTINCSFTSNTSSSARTATIQVTANGATGSPANVTVTQAGQSMDIPALIPIDWIQQFGTNNDDWTSDVGVDSSGNMIVTWSTYGTLPGQISYGAVDAFVRKYRADSSQIWTHQFGGTDWDDGDYLAIDQSDNIIVAGQTYSSLPGQTLQGKPDAYVGKYDAQGKLLWLRQFGSAGYDCALGVTTDSLNNVIVSGYTFGTLPGKTPLGSNDAFVRKYNSDGVEQWTQQFGSAEIDFAIGIATDSTNNIVVVGYTRGALDGQSSAASWDAFIRKYNSTGTVVWTRQFGTAGDDEAFAVAIDIVGGIYVVGITDGALPSQTIAGSSDAFVRKYSSDGTELWTRQFGTPFSDNAWQVKVDRSGNVFITGDTEGVIAGQASLGGKDAFVRSYDTEGNLRWTRQFGSTGSDRGNGIALNAAGDVYVVGSTEGVLPGQVGFGKKDAFLAKIGPFNTPVISGFVKNGSAGIPHVAVTFNPASGQTSTDNNGAYSRSVTSGWIGDITPSLSGYIFNPNIRNYTNNVIAHLKDQDFAAVYAVNKGDIDGDGNVNLTDAILALQVMAGRQPASLNLAADVNSDGRIGMADVIYILQKVAGMQP